MAFEEYSDSESDNEAPEEVAQTSAKRSSREALKKVVLLESKAAATRKAKNRKVDAALKKGKQNKKAVIEEEPVFEEEEEGEFDDEDEDEEGDEEEGESEEEEEEEGPRSANHLDPALFASAASFYEPEKPAEAGKGKQAMKRKVRAEKRERALAAEERAQLIGAGGSRQVGDLTLQHLPTPSHTHASLASTALPSHTSATKFLTQRLYSKKRVISVLDASQPRPSSEDSGRKRTKKRAGGGMSEESKMLLGMGMDDGSKEKLNAETAEDKIKSRKRTLLLQAQGIRKSATVARPLASARAKRSPAANFAVSTRKS